MSKQIQVTKTLGAMSTTLQVCTGCVQCRYVFMHAYSGTCRFDLFWERATGCPVRLNFEYVSSVLMWYIQLNREFEAPRWWIVIRVWQRRQSQN